MMTSLGVQIVWLLVLAIPVACIAWTVTHEEVFREPREFCLRERSPARTLFWRKFFYLFTCEYCFSHYVSIGILAITRYHLLFPDWRGYVISFFSLVWIANQYMSIYNRLRLDIKHEQVEIKAEEHNVAQVSDQRKAA
jgi:hypothetical protein